MTPMQARTVELGADYATTRSGLLVPASHAPKRRPTAVELFAGAGGFGLGFHLAGWHVAAAVEHWDVAAATYVINLGGPDTVMHIDRDCYTGNRRKRAPKTRQEAIEAGPPAIPGRDRHITMTAREWLGEHDGVPVAGSGWIADRGAPGDDRPALDEPAVEHMWIADVRELTGAQILGALGMQPGDLGCVFGGPPCQGFSMAGRRDEMDPRNSLVFDMARLVVEMQPQTMCMENVPGMVRMHTAEGVPVVDALALILADGGMGTYEALRKSLSKSAGVGGIIRERATASRASAAGDDVDDDPCGPVEDDGLFSLAEVTG